MTAAPDNAESAQAHFARRFGSLTQPHVRALAWLLDAPDLLDPDDPYWEGRIASLGPVSAATAQWLAQLDADPAPLLAELGERVYTRLGLYAEKLMAFYFRAQGTLVAHGLQVRAARNDTVGEFDFLLDAGPDGVQHIEFATKFYLLEGEAATRFDTFVGPNLADSLGAKMRKIIERQLVLGSHPAAQAVLPRPVLQARALVKGWLFYPAAAAPLDSAISGRHCRGFWCPLADVPQHAQQRFVVLPRLQWLAPYKGSEAVLDAQELHARLAEQFARVPMPVLVAVVEDEEGVSVETARGFIVPDDWRARAAFRQKLAASVT